MQHRREYEMKTSVIDGPVLMRQKAGIQLRRGTGDAAGSRPDSSRRGSAGRRSARPSLPKCVVFPLSTNRAVEPGSHFTVGVRRSRIVGYVLMTHLWPSDDVAVDDQQETRR